MPLDKKERAEISSLCKNKLIKMIADTHNSVAEGLSIHRRYFPHEDNNEYTQHLQIVLGEDQFERLELAEQTLRDINSKKHNIYSGTNYHHFRADGQTINCITNRTKKYSCSPETKNIWDMQPLTDKLITQPTPDY